MNPTQSEPANSEPGQLVVVSGPSGAGKSTVLRKLIQTCDLPLEMSVSATTRPMRPGEVDGKDYRFVTKDEFLKMEAAGDFLETAEVFGVGHPAKGTGPQSVELDTLDPFVEITEVNLKTGVFWFLSLLVSRKRCTLQ